MVTIAVDGGHGINTAGKRTPAGEREWTFNNTVVLAAIEELRKYVGVNVIRVDDPTGVRDVPLTERVKKANDAKAVVYWSAHHNAYLSKWGSHTGVETYINSPKKNNPKSLALAEAVHPKLVYAMELANRGIKEYPYYVLANTNMPSILTEGGFMDSLIDIEKMRQTSVLRAQGIAIAQGIASYLKLTKKDVTQTDNKAHRLLTGTFNSQEAALSAKASLHKIYGWQTIYVIKDGNAWRIKTGTFSTEAVATSMAESIRKRYGWIVHVQPA